MLAVERLGLYLHIPFCRSICNYCNFNRGLLDSTVKVRYISALEAEIRRAGCDASVDTIYFGGGTPSLLTSEEIACLVTACREAFNVECDAEVTLEVNPETVTIETVRGWINAGVSRVSLGVQSFHDAELQRLDRCHTAERAREAVSLTCAAGFDVRVDLMLWLPMQKRDDCARSIDTLVKLRPNHASLYMLELYPNAPLKEEMARAGWSQAPDDDAAAMYLDTLAQTDAAGYEQYEISNIAQPGKRCRHNLKYWSDGAWLGFGCGAHSTRDGVRWRNVADTNDYIDAIDNQSSPVVERRSLTNDEQLGDTLFMGLRVVEGVDLERVGFRYGIDVMGRYGASLEPFIQAGMLVHDDGRLKLTRAGMLLSNEVMKTFV